MKLVIGSDKSGFALRKAIEAYLTEQGYACIVLGPQDEEQAVPFYTVAPKAAELIQAGEVQRGILICGTGMGMSQVANKHKGIRAACVETVYSARMARVINDSNLLCLGGWMIAPVLGVAMVEAYLTASFVTGVEEWRKEWLTNAKNEIYAMEDKLLYQPKNSY